MNRKIFIGIAAAVIAAVSTLGGCGCGTNHDSGNPTNDIQLTWHRVDTPPSIQTEYFACFGTDGILLDQSDANATVTPDDPMCPKGGEPYRIVHAVGSQPKQILGTYVIPPDETGQPSL